MGRNRKEIHKQQKEKEKILILDCSNLCYMVAYSLRELEGENVIFGFLKYILSFAKKFKTNKFCFCWDSRKSYRKILYSEYKAGRRSNWTDEDREYFEKVYEQMRRLREEILPQMGFKNNYKVTGFEADDLIANLVLANDMEFIIVSTDNDLYQLLSDRVSIYNPKTQKIFTAKQFQKMYGILPQQWAMVKAIAGCKADNVTGIKGIGEKTAIKYLLKELKGKKFDLIESNSEVIERNLKLVKLPFRKIDLKIDLNEEFYSLDFLDVFMKLKFRSFESKFDEWKGNFSLIPGRKQ